MNYSIITSYKFYTMLIFIDFTKKYNQKTDNRTLIYIKCKYYYMNCLQIHLNTYKR